MTHDLMYFATNNFKLTVYCCTLSLQFMVAPCLYNLWLPLMYWSLQFMVTLDVLVYCIIDLLYYYCTIDVLLLQFNKCFAV